MRVAAFETKVLKEFVNAESEFYKLVIVVACEFIMFAMFTMEI
jgi:hypothetical protein